MIHHRHRRGVEPAAGACRGSTSANCSAPHHLLPGRAMAISKPPDPPRLSCAPAARRAPLACRSRTAQAVRRLEHHGLRARRSRRLELRTLPRCLGCERVVCDRCGRPLEVDVNRSARLLALGALVLPIFGCGSDDEPDAEPATFEGWAGSVITDYVPATSLTDLSSRSTFVTEATLVDIEDGAIFGSSPDDEAASHSVNLIFETKAGVRYYVERPRPAYMGIDELRSVMPLGAASVIYLQPNNDPRPRPSSRAPLRPYCGARYSRSYDGRRPDRDPARSAPVERS